MSALDDASKRERAIRAAGSRGGLTLVELVIAAGLLAGVLYASLEALRGNREMVETANARNDTARRVRELVDAITRETSRANGVVPRAFTTGPVGATATRLALDGAEDFPPAGAIVFEPASADRELGLYSDHGTQALDGLERGAGCDDGRAHGDACELNWGGAATVLEDQTAPASQFDGRALELEGALAFRGLGTGFCFQVPTDPTGAEDFLDGVDVRWGAAVRGLPSAGAYSAFQYEVTGVAREADSGVDVNADGDLEDTFDLGRVVLWTWDLSTPGTGPARAAAGPSNIVQERCRWGADLDGDGFADPLFLWDPGTRRLSIRITALAAAQNRPPQVLR
ncbi:MAG: hypothetical protein AAFP22_00775, partial [Planctomycetota bacterium]